MMYHKQRPAYNITTKLFLILVNESIFIFNSHYLTIPKLYHIHLADSFYIAHNGFFSFRAESNEFIFTNLKIYMLHYLNLISDF